MPRSKRIRRTLAIRVSEPHPGEIINPNSAGQRFASGWALFERRGMLDGAPGLRETVDPVVAAGFLAAKAAWDAHHYAVNWIGVDDKGGAL